MGHHVLFIDRKLGDIHGVMTLQYVGADGEARPMFKQMPITSGQKGWTDGGAEDWARGLGPTPMGTHWLCTRKEKLTGAEPVGTPFYLLSTNQRSRRIQGPDGSYRENAGIHLENDKPGTAGCTAIIRDEPHLDAWAWAFFDYLDRISEFEPYIKTVVL